MAPRQGHYIQKRQNTLRRENHIRVRLRLRWERVRPLGCLRGKWRQHAIIVRCGCAWMEGERRLGRICRGNVAEWAVLGVHGCCYMHVYMYRSTYMTLLFGVGWVIRAGVSIGK